MKQFFKIQLFLALALSWGLVANATPAQDFRALIAQGDVVAMEEMIAEIDARNTDSGLKENDKLRDVFTLFQSTHPEVSAVLEKWRGVSPNSIYRKTADGWYFEHLGWIARGSSYAKHTHAKAFEQMSKHFNRSAALAWDAFEERKDFVPASDLVATHYLHGRGKWAVEEFARVALGANPSPSLLDKIVLTASPKWGGSWRQISNYCEVYGDQMVSGQIYNSDVCKAQAVFDMPSTYNGGNKILLGMARRIMNETPETALRNARYWDLFYLRPELITPQTKDLAISLFDPLSPNASRDAYQIEQGAGVVGFSEAQAGKIGAARRARNANDPLNPEYLGMLYYKTLAQFPAALTEWGVTVGLSSEADDALLERLEEVAALAPYRPEIWARFGNVSAQQPGGNVLFERGLEHHEKAVILSNYQGKYVALYFNRLALAHSNLKLRIKADAPMVQVSNKGDPLKGVEIDPIAKKRTLECPLVRAARLAEFACDENESSRGMCDGEPLFKNPGDIVKEANQESYCPALLRASFSELQLDAVSGL